MSRGDELRRFLRVLRMLSGWTSPGDMAQSLGVNRATVHRILVGIQEEVGLSRRKIGRRVEYRLTTPEEREPVRRKRR